MLQDSFYFPAAGKNATLMEILLKNEFTLLQWIPFMEGEVITKFPLGD